MHGRVRTRTEHTRAKKSGQLLCLPEQTHVKSDSCIHSFMYLFIHSFVSLCLTVTYTSMAIGALLALFISFPPRRSRIVCLASIPSNKLCSMYLEKNEEGCVYSTCVCVCVCVCVVCGVSSEMERSYETFPLSNPSY